MYRHLLRLARKHDVFVVTDDNPKVRHLPLPCKGIRLKDNSQNLLRRITVRLGLEVLWILLEARNISKKILKIINNKTPDLVLTVWHSSFLLAAAEIAQKLNVPLILIIHDDWESMINKKTKFDYILRKKLKKIFQQASQRMCVSGGIIKVLQQRHGSKKCEILYPISGTGAFKQCNTKKPLSPLRLGFFGELGGNFEILEWLADMLPRINSTLTIFSHGESSRRQNLAKKEGVHEGGHLSEKRLFRYFAKYIDVVVIPQGFDKENALLRQTCFPSKIPEACRFNLPILVIAPKYGSAYAWAKGCLPPKCILSKLNNKKIAASIQYLKGRKNWALAKRKVLIAACKFKPDKLHEKLEEALYNSLKK